MTVLDYEPIEPHPAWASPNRRCMECKVGWHLYSGPDCWMCGGPGEQTVGTHMMGYWGPLSSNWALTPLPY